MRAVKAPRGLDWRESIRRYSPQIDFVRSLGAHVLHTRLSNHLMKLLFRSIPSWARWKICGLSYSFHLSFPTGMCPASYWTDRSIRRLQPFPNLAFLGPIWSRWEGAL